MKAAIQVLRRALQEDPRGFERAMASKLQRSSFQFIFDIF